MLCWSTQKNGLSLLNLNNAQILSWNFKKANSWNQSTTNALARNWRMWRLGQTNPCLKWSKSTEKSFFCFKNQQFTICLFFVFHVLFTSLSWGQNHLLENRKGGKWSTGQETPTRSHWCVDKNSTSTPTVCCDPQVLSVLCLLYHAG